MKNIGKICKMPTLERSNMPSLKNKRHEIFAQSVVSGLSLADAVIKAGYKPKYAKTNSTKIMAKKDVSERIKELEKELEKE